MPYHWGGSFTIDQINAKAVTAEVTPSPRKSAVLIGKKASKAPLRSKSSKAGTPTRSGVIAFELTFRSRVTNEEVTVRVPGVGAFHDPAKGTTLADARRLGVEIAKALNNVFHSKESGGRG
jgi:hypothetical protein